MARIRRGWWKPNHPDRSVDVVGAGPLSRGMTKPADPVAIARNLIRFPSVTPAEGGALAYLEGALKGAGFAVNRVTFGEPGAADVENLYARIGSGRPHLVLAGHTDVVSPGEAGAWTHPPFAAEIAAGVFSGGGAGNMRGALACGGAPVPPPRAPGGGGRRVSSSS